VVILRSVSAAFQTALEADQTAELVTLVEIGTTPASYIAFWPQDVTFGGNTYTADGGAHSEITSDIEYNRPGMTLTLQNVEDASGAVLPWTGALSSGTINGVEVTFRIVSTALLSDADAVLMDAKWYISGWTLKTDQVIFKLGSPHDALTLEVPTRPLGAPTCVWKYQVGACTSTSTRPSCPKTVQGCSERYDEEALRIGPSFPFYAKNARRRR